jgi:hypothetical protein
MKSGCVESRRREQQSVILIFAQVLDVDDRPYLTIRSALRWQLLTFVILAALLYYAVTTRTIFLRGTCTILLSFCTCATLSSITTGAAVDLRSLTGIALDTLDAELTICNILVGLAFRFFTL